MAERRMFAKTIIDSDAFLDMPLSSQALYFHLCMRADDDGFVNNPKKIQRMVGCSDDDGKILIGKKFIIPFESGVVVIKHWKIHNYIQKDRYHETKYEDEKNMLAVKENGAYTIPRDETNNGYKLDTDCIQDVYKMDTECVQDGYNVSKMDTKRIQDGHKMDTEVRLELDKVSLDKVSVSKRESEGKNTKKFIKPTLEEVRAYCYERGNRVDPDRFYAYYESCGWTVQGRSMKDWKAAIRYWETGDNKTYNRRGAFFAPTGNEDEYAKVNAGALQPMAPISEVDATEDDLRSLGIGSALNGNNDN